MNKLLSVSVACYNVEQYLQHGLASYRDERLKGRLEVLIINDGSTDRTKQIAQAFASECPEIFRFIDKENGGHGSTINAGIQYATGKYFRVVDGDDWVNTQGLCALLDKLETCEADLVIDDTRDVHMQTKEETPVAFPSSIEEGRVYPIEQVSAPVYDLCYRMQTMTVRTQLLQKEPVRILENTFYVDNEFVLDAVLLCQTVAFYHVEVYQYLVGNPNQSVDSQNYVKRYDHSDRVLMRLFDIIGRAPLEEGSSKKAHIYRRMAALISGHYSIALVYNRNRAQGKKMAAEFREAVRAKSPELFRAVEKRYWLFRLLHMLGVDYERLQALKKRLRYGA